MIITATVVGLALAGCGDDSSSNVGTEGSTGTPGTTTLPLPTATDTQTGETQSSSSGPQTSADSTGTIPPDLPPVGTDDCHRLTDLLDALAVETEPAVQQQLIDEFVRTVSYGDHGFPIAEDGKLAVVHQGGPGQSLSLAGDFNGWAAGEHVLSEPVPGFYYAIVERARTPQGLYKLVTEDEGFFADPLARRFGWDRFGEYSQVDALPDRSHHERWLGFDLQAEPLQPRTVTVYLPAGALAEVELPVLYMHDGQNLFDPEAFFGGWGVSETLDVAIGDGTVAPMVVVGIDNTPARFEEYTPVPDVLDGMQVGGQADDYVEFVVEGVLPFVEARYPVASDANGVGTMGSSLGGLVSLYLGLRHPEIFGHAASMSGTIDWGTFGAQNPTIDALYMANPPLGLRLYVDSGGEAGVGCPDGDSDNYCGNVRMADTVRGLGWVDEDDLFYRWQPGALHNEAAWADRLLPALVDWWAVAG